MRVMGVSGSPVKDSNTDKAVKIVMEATGARRKDFYKLSDYTINPCNACLGCVESNRCIIEDDGVMLAERAFKADILIIGGYTPYSSLDSRTKTFIERLYPLHHRHGLMSYKQGAAIITSLTPPETSGTSPAAQKGLDAIKDFMLAENINYVGGVAVPGNAPCVRCKTGIQCQVSSLKVMYGPEATPESVGVNTLEEDKNTMEALEKLGYALYEKYYA